MKLSAFMSDEIADKKHCPKCNAPLEKKGKDYAVAVKEDGETESFIMSCDGGAFCPTCPAVVLDSRVFSKMLSSVVQKSSARYSVVGMVDVDAIPEDKQDIPLGDDDNPIPIIEFEYASTKKQRPRKAKSKKTKVGRNDPCPCGSGKKYKKCCMGKEKNQDDQ